MHKQKTGFTLIELLVVISIIAILSVIGVTAYTDAQKKARDATRIADMKSFQSVYEQYYSTTGSTYNASCPIMNAGFSGAAPTSPKLPGYTSNCTASSYCVCAALESQPGNANADANATCSGLGGGTTHFCVKNLQ